MAYTRIIENLVLTNTLRLDGHEWDNTLIRNVTIQNASGDGIFLKDVNNVRIENCTIKNVSDSGIRLSVSGSTKGVEIVGNTLSGIGKDGIASGQRWDAGVDHPGLKVLNNTIDNTGLSGNSGLLHGIYVQSTEFLIEGNHITRSTDGNAISVRSSGVVRDNLIDGTGKSGISYYADHMRGPTNTLTIEKNIIVDSANGETGRSDIDLLPIPDSNNAVRNFIIRDNVLTDTDGAPIGVHGDYAGLGVKPQMTNNPVISESSARTMIQQELAGGETSTPTPTPTPTPAPAPEPAPEPTPVTKLFTLPDSGASTKTISGTDSNNTLRGTDGNDTLSGRGGIDTTYGAKGDDRHIINDPSDKVVEYAGQGIDTVLAGRSYTLPANVENIELTGTYNFNATGNELNNKVTGNGSINILHGGAGNDVIIGKGGADVLYGDAGSDIFTIKSISERGDAIMDFEVGKDMLDLRGLMTEMGYKGSNPLADGALRISESNGDASVYARSGTTMLKVATLDNVHAADLHLQVDLYWM